MELDSDMYDDNYAGTVLSGPDKIETESGVLEEGGSSLRENALHLQGTDDMSTSDVHKYLALFTTDSKPRIEWIDDTSLNLVYYTKEDARVALAHLTNVPTFEIDSVTPQPAKDNPEKADARLKIRYATTEDKKERGAKDRSRWYLFHPEDDPDSRPRQKRRGGRAEEPYSRTGRHERRIVQGTAGGADLFADRLTGDGSALPPVSFKSDLFEEKTQMKKEADADEDVFAKRVLEAAKSSQRHGSKPDVRASLPADDLFARSTQGSRVPESSLADRIGGPMSSLGKSGAVDLFPNRAVKREFGGGDLASRIAGGPVRSKGMAIRGVGRRTKASDLF